MSLLEAIFAILQSISEAFVSLRYVVKKKSGWRYSEEEERTEHMRQ